MATPPTHFSTNKFTYGSQKFVNMNGIPRCREDNPALFTATTLETLATDSSCSRRLYLLWDEEKNNKAELDEMKDGPHSGRYTVAIMGFFTVCTGLVYNDCFSLGLNLFGLIHVARLRMSRVAHAVPKPQ